MTATPQSRLNLLKALIRLPGVTTASEEDAVGRFIHDHLAALPWFREHPDLLFAAPTPLEGDERPLHAVFALVEAARPTRQTVILTGHYDVVDADVYGPLREAAFDPDALPRLLDPASLDAASAADLASGRFLFGRGAMDMKAGVAVELELLRDFADNRELFDVNLLLVVVPDEENLSAGMRGAVPHLLRLQRERGLDYLAAVNAEPTEAGRPNAAAPTLFLGTVGKLMPVFLCLGRESHVGAYYDGLSAALLSSRIHVLAEGNPDLADPVNGECCPSWICLEHKILRAGYSVTVPGASVIWFNCYASSDTPAAVLDRMQAVAEQAGRETTAQVRRSRAALAALGCAAGSAPDREVRVCRVEDVRARAEARLGKAELAAHLERFLNELEQPDPREAAVAVLRELVLCAAEEGPLVVIGFLPPYYPPRSSRVPGIRHEALVRAADVLIAEAEERFGLKMETAEFFTGLCDLSYFGFQGKPDDLTALEQNLPGWGAVYSVPTAALAALDVPVINFGPSGRDPHKKTERLELRFSLERYPELLAELIRAVAQENSRNR